MMTSVDTDLIQVPGDRPRLRIVTRLARETLCTTRLVEETGAEQIDPAVTIGRTFSDVFSGVFSGVVPGSGPVSVAPRPAGAGGPPRAAVVVPRGWTDAK